MARLIFFFLIFAALAPLGWVAGLWTAVVLLWLFTTWLTRDDERQRQIDMAEGREAYDRYKAGLR